MKVISPILPTIRCHGNVPCAIRKTGPDWQHSRKYIPFGERIVKIGPVDPELALLNLKKKETEGKIYSPVGMFAEQTKQTGVILVRELIKQCVKLTVLTEIDAV